jgi:hypothetical protein
MEVLEVEVEVMVYLLVIVLPLQVVVVIQETVYQVEVLEVFLIQTVVPVDLKVVVMDGLEMVDLVAEEEDMATSILVVAVEVAIPVVVEDFIMVLEAVEDPFHL